MPDDELVFDFPNRAQPAPRKEPERPAPGLSGTAIAELKRLVRDHPDLQPLPLAARSSLAAVMVGPDGLVLVDDQFRPGEAIPFDEIEHASVTEDVGNRYEVELSLAREGDDPTLHFDSRVMFAMLFAALRSHDVACRFGFTPRRQRGDSAGEPGSALRLAVILAASATALVCLWQRGTKDFFEVGILVGLLVIAVVAIVPAVILGALFNSACEPRNERETFPLLTPAPPAEPDAKLDDRPLGAAMITSETYADVDTGRQTPDAAEAKQISEIERLLD
jgi:hypothetical protein